MFGQIRPEPASCFERSLNLEGHMADETVEGEFVSEFEHEDIHRRILESLQTGVCLVDQKRKVRFWNEGAEKTTGHLRQDVLGHDAQELVQSGSGGAEEDAPDTKDFVAILVC
jgi:PAS domain-containing protein